MTDQIKSAFNAKAVEKIVFDPEIKVKRLRDILYISELRKTKTGSILAVVEVGTTNDKAPMPLALLDDKSLLAIHSKLRSF